MEVGGGALPRGRLALRLLNQAVEKVEDDDTGKLLADAGLAFQAPLTDGGPVEDSEEGRCRAGRLVLRAKPADPTSEDKGKLQVLAELFAMEHVQGDGLPGAEAVLWPSVGAPRPGRRRR